MSTYQPNVNPSSPEGQALQDSIQKQLAILGWSQEDDAVMAEYCLVMLGNRKTPDQISTELSDLIGGEFDPSFVTWLFDELKKHYPDPSSSSSASTSAPAPSATSTSSGPSSTAIGSATTSTPSGPSSSLPPRPAQPTGRMFGAAVSGVKRDSRELSTGEREPPQQRQRFDAGHGRNGAGGPKSLFDRMGGNNAQFAPGRNGNPPLVNTLGMPQAAFDAITQTIQAVNSGAHPSALSSIPFPALAAHPLSTTLPPPILAQAQAAAMAQAQAFAQMQNVWNSPAPGPFGGSPGGGGGRAGSGGFNPNAAPFNPAFGAGPGGPNGFRGGPAAAAAAAANGRPFPSPAHGHPAPHSNGAPPHPPLPKKPELEAICKHGVECSKPACGFSHPSPVATKESGLVLSSDACDQQLKCQDPDCPKSHVSRAQKNAASAAAVAAPTPNAASAAFASSSSVPVSDPSQIAGAGTKPCKFGSSCTRPGCVFLHPWDQRGDPNGAGQVPCRYGAACNRPDCHFSHPPSRSAPYNRSKFSATFNKPPPPPATTTTTTTVTPTDASAKKPTSTPSTASVGAWPEEKPEHVSERLKRFSTQANNDSGRADDKERILPGQQGQGQGESKEAGGGGGDKVEIHFDEEEEKKVEMA
ncbi:hypothetical protein JCM10212_003399 [Sporobolomyces blumeae]